ncbi:MAG: Rrf2 family transcriptional regulator [Bacteroidales bacterium]|nr:Rrf2 family transcriptional regulator [Bacteroidales bacterium]
MRVNTKIRYGLRAMMEIATSTEPTGVLQKDIALKQDISVKYLDPIISALKLKGLIINSKGRGSGYRLARPASEITMWDIYTAFEQISVVDCINNEGFCDKSCDCSTKDYWSEFTTDFENMLHRKTLQQIIEHKNSVLE